MNRLNTKTADEHFVAVAQDITNDEIRTDVLKKFNTKSLVKAYKNGEKRIEIEYPVRASEGATMWLFAGLDILQNPDTGDIEGLSFVKNITRRKRDEEIIKSIANDSFDFISVYDTSSGMLEMHGGVWKYRSVKSGDQIHLQKYIDMLLKDHVAPSEHAEFLKASDIDMIIESLELDPYYMMTYNFTDDLKRFCKKQIAFTWLNDNKTELLVKQSDITGAYTLEEKRMNELKTALSAAEQASVAKTEFLSRMSHEIRTPMNAIIGLDGLALQENDITDEMKDHLQKIGVSAKFLLSLINDILDMSRIESGKMSLDRRKFSTGDLIDSINTILYEQCQLNGLEYECIRNGSLDDCYVGDETKLQQVLINILGNSVKFTPAGGRIGFSVEEILRTHDISRIRFIISDSGVGIDKEFIPHLFELFTQESRANTTKYGGTGLGLAISKSIVDMMNGAISVDSVKGEGSKFTIDVEVGHSNEGIDVSDHIKANNDVRVEDGKDFDFSGEKVLLVEDNEINMEIAESLLKIKKCTVETAENGAVAVEKFKTSPVGYYDAIFMDIRMPVMDGLQATACIRALDREDAKIVPIIAMTANAFMEDRELSIRSGMDAHLAKPVEPAVLYKTLSDFTGK